MDSLVDRILELESISYDKEVMTRLFSYRPYAYIKVSVVISPRLPPRADNRRSTLIYGPI